MKSTFTLVTLMCLSLPITASPVARYKAEKRVLSDIGCYLCKPGPWSVAPDCTASNSALISSFNNPPKTIKFDPSDFCSHFLQPYTYKISPQIITGVFTDVSRVTVQATTTTTDVSQPTVTIYCPIKNDDATCGISADTIDPTAMQEDWASSPPVNDPKDCHQTCLSLPHCKSYRVSEFIDPKGSWNCDIFRIALGKDGKNVPGGRPGDQFFDRDCPEHVPSQCGPQKRAFDKDIHSPAAAVKAPAVAVITPAAAVITPAPVPRDAAAQLQGRDWTLPDYLSSTWGFDIGPYWIYQACSCVISSPLPMLSLPSKATYYSYTATVKTTTTTTQTKTIYTEVHHTTVYTSIA
ncbi:uncharacterized protein BP5553_10589 [Venustampulla echinocandica]|uniref:Apple domain-containing protein n=1 Tax=Venustampulla echinocandica TaxID=2656787 RepID=A0A370T8Z6_9HELO|nr:uncharacterized protein BP5553_10589 [Venustampulla echinocandica]RDL29962.1 hypothetical protein BP5553_10589 [Venustampulla echinocandica]